MGRTFTHVVRRASRWHNGQEIDSKHDSTLLVASVRSWIQLFGAIETVIVDGEGGVTSAKICGGDEEARCPGGHRSSATARSSHRTTRGHATMGTSNRRGTARAR
eukprot:5526297-Pyramimonas_sp.AAC.1